MTRYRSTLVSLVGLALSYPLFANAAPPAGERWQTTTQMSADWMPVQIPPVSIEVCTAKDWKQPPGGPDENCQLSDVKVAGSKLTWKQRCAGPPEMTGAGEITRAENSYDGQVRMTSAQGEMNLKLSGRKTGTCDNPQ
jgi:Protein of unknown function (DUF3617)